MNKEQTRIIMSIDTLARINKDSNIYNIAKTSLLNGENKILSKNEALETVSMLSDKQEQFNIDFK